MKKSAKKHHSIISQHAKQSPNSVRRFSDHIPVDLLIYIFSRIPAKSIARFRCVSKFWSSILRRHEFTTRPRLLFTIMVDDELFIFSTPQPRNLDNNSSLVATRYKYIHRYNFASHICPPIFGLVCLRKGVRNVICNPVTGEFITLPRVVGMGKERIYFGFDPINKKYKVLCVMTWLPYNTHWVLTLEYGKSCIWRKMVKDLLTFPYRPGFSEICINGVLYYDANNSEGPYIIVCFDLRSEKFSFVNIDQDMSRGTLFNYKGKLGAVNQRRYEFVFWVLDDADKHKWSKTISVSRVNIVYGIKDFVGMTSTGEIVFSPNHLQESNYPFYICFYNIERKTFTRVNIQGFEEFMNSLKSKYNFIKFDRYVFNVNTFIDYVENLKYM